MNITNRIAVIAITLAGTATIAAGQSAQSESRPAIEPATTSAPITQNTRRAQRPPEVGCMTVNTVITLASPSISRTAGFEYAQIGTSDLSREIERNAEIVYNANQYSRLSSRAPGVIVEVHKDLGDHIEKGEVVATMDSMALGSAKADLLQSSELLALWQANADREQALMEKGASTERALLEAQTHLTETRIAVSRAKQQLRNLGLSDAGISRVIEENDTGSLLRITAPFNGTLVERAAVMGDVVDQNDMLFAIADTGLMWAMIDLSERDLASVSRGQDVVFRIDGIPNREFPGRLAWISTQLDKKTRTIKARAELDNGGGMLKAFMFGRATITAGASTQAVTVPKSAVQWDGSCNIAFVRTNETGTTFQPVQLTLGFDTGDRYEVLSGLSGGETVVTGGSFVLKNELLKDSMGAGCCEVDHLNK